MNHGKLLLTGATGFIGRQAVPLLIKQGYQVHVTCRGDLSEFPWRDDVTPHRANLLEPGVPEQIISQVRPSHLLHLAWNAEPGVFWNALDNLDWTAATLSLIRAFSAHGGKRAVCAGTCAEYDWSHDYLSEDTTPCVPHTLYGRSKQATRLLIETAAPALNLSFAWGRIFFLYGPHESPQRLLPYVITSLIKDTPALCSNGLQERDFMHVEDVATAFVKLLDSEVTGPVNIASGECYPLRKAIELIGDQLDRANLIKLGARATNPSEPHRMAANINRLTQEVRFQPRYSLEEGVRSTVDWWKNNYHDF